MKLCTLNNAYKHQDNLTSYKLFKEYNMLNIEVNPLNFKSDLYSLSKEDIDKFILSTVERNVSIEALEYTEPENLFIFKNRKTRLELLNNIKDCIILCYKLGVPVININYLKNNNMDNISKDMSYQILLEFFAELGDFASNKNVILTLGPCSKYSLSNDIIKNAIFRINSQCINFIMELNNPYVKLNLTNSIILENHFDYEELITIASPYLHNFYIIEDYLIPLNNKNVIRNSSLLTILDSIKYSELLTIDFKDRKNVKDIVQFLLHSNLGILWS